MSDTSPPTPPMGSETKFAQKVGEAVARQMARANPKAKHIPPHRWSQKLARFAQRLVFLGFFVAGVKLKWPEYVLVGLGLASIRALAPDLADGTVRWALSMLSTLKGVKESQ